MDLGFEMLCTNTNKIKYWKINGQIITLIKNENEDENENENEELKFNWNVKMEIEK